MHVHQRPAAARGSRVASNSASRITRTVLDLRTVGARLGSCRPPLEEHTAPRAIQQEAALTASSPNRRNHISGRRTRSRARLGHPSSASRIRPPAARGARPHPSRSTVEHSPRAASATNSVASVEEIQVPALSHQVGPPHNGGQRKAVGQRLARTRDPDGRYSAGRTTGREAEGRLDLVEDQHRARLEARRRAASSQAMAGAPITGSRRSPPAAPPRDGRFQAGMSSNGPCPEPFRAARHTAPTVGRPPPVIARVHHRSRRVATARCGPPPARLPRPS